MPLKDPYGSHTDTPIWAAHNGHMRAQIASPYGHAHKGPMWGPDTKLIKDPYGSHTDKPI